MSLDQYQLNVISNIPIIVYYDLIEFPHSAYKST